MGVQLNNAEICLIRTSSNPELGVPFDPRFRPQLKAMPQPHVEVLYGGEFVFDWLGYLLQIWRAPSYSLVREEQVYRESIVVYKEVPYEVVTTPNLDEPSTWRIFTDSKIGWALLDGLDRIFRDIYGPYAPGDNPGPKGSPKPPWKIPTFRIEEKGKLLGTLRSRAYWASSEVKVNKRRDVQTQLTPMAMLELLEMFVALFTAFLGLGPDEKLFELFPTGGVILSITNHYSERASYFMRITMCNPSEVPYVPVTVDYLLSAIRSFLGELVLEDDWSEKGRTLMYEGSLFYGYIGWGLGNQLADDQTIENSCKNGLAT